MKLHYLLFIFFVSTTAFSQEDAWVYFNAKPNAQNYLDNPLLMLSQRALDRRASQNIALDETDVPLEASYVNQLLSAPGITVLAQSKWLNAVHVRGEESAVSSLKLLPFVDKVLFANRTLNSTARKVSANTSSQTRDKLKTTINYNYGTSANQIQMLNGHILHQQNYTGSGKIIAVMDAGFPGVNSAQPFEKLRSNNQILGGYDYVSRNANFYTGDSHGTLVLSTMGGYKENQFIGTAPEASYYLYITEDDNYEGPVEESLWVEAAEEADRVGADIITTSLGYFGDFTKPAYNYTYADMNGSTTFIARGAEIASAKGIVVVASAGNEGNQVEKHIGSPADAASVLTVGSVTSAGVRSGFSSIGPSYDGRIKPDVMAQGTQTVISDSAGNIGTANGTSFSCPVMAGMIACLWQAFPSKTSQEIKNMIIQSADKYTIADNNYGYGIPDFSRALSVPTVTENEFLYYPNPAMNSVTFIFSNEKKEAAVTLYSVPGQKVLEQKLSAENPELSIQSLKSGLYFFTLEGNGICKRGKIIKQ
jgi:hypothetical protein